LLRILLWKIGFEWAHLQRILWPRVDRKIWYFAFGANLSPEVLAQRRIRVYESFDHVLEDAALRFTLAGFYKGHGYASADIAEGEVVYGKMYLILQRDALRMDYFEGVPFLDVHDKVFREFNDSEFYYYRGKVARSGLKPTREYLDYLLTAYREMDIVPEDYIDSLAGTEVLEQFLPPDQTGDFVSAIERWPGLVHPVLVFYEGCCQRLVEFLWNRSLLHWMIR
jgi:hypothetical protein